MQAMNYDCCRYFAGPDHTLDDFERVMTSLRKAFVDAAKENFGRDFSGMPDETSAGELYIDSLAVTECCRGKGIATSLLKAVVEKAKAMGLPAVGLLVDKGNPKAETLYERIGFKYVGDNDWGGHPMKHMQYTLQP